MSLNTEEDLILPASPREESPASNPITLSGNSENGSASDYPDSGLGLNSHAAAMSGASNEQTLLNLRPRLSANPPPALGTSVRATDLRDLRRPSIVGMIDNGGLKIGKHGCEIDMENVLPEDVEMFYAFHGPGGVRRGSHSSEDGAESGGQQLNSEAGSSQQLSNGSGGGMRFFPAHSWWNPTFNSPILERHWRKKVIEFLRRRFRIAVMFIGLFALLWIVFFSIHLPFDPPESEAEAESSNDALAAYSVRYSWWYVAGGACTFVIVGLLLILTFSRFYSRFAFLFSIFLALVLMACSCSLALAIHFDNAVQGFSTISFVAQFAITGVVILIVFTLSRLPLWLSLLFSIMYIVVLEVLVGVFTYGMHTETYPRTVFIHSTIARVIFEFCLILSGVATAYLSQVRLHATFWKIAQCVISQKALDLERELEEKTIHSMMPKPFADELMTLQVQLAFMVKQKVGLEQETLDPALQSMSAPFAFYSMDRVTILFADIVDFTEFSSTLSAPELVGILNEVFSIFDEMVTKYKCEKISTLGDCYFCVSGCPESITSHADNCVNMGLAIIEELEDFRKRTGLPIEMRIGVHTGSVFCGVMGTRRFKFDVWSEDVNLAKRIESVGTAGRVLISSTTRNYLSSGYVVEDSNIQDRPPALAHMQLYYVVGRRNRALSMGTSVMEWRRKIQLIDTIHKPESLPKSSSRTTTECNPFLCLPWRRKAVAVPVRKMPYSHSTSSIVDIFSKQTQLQRYTSYAGLETTQDQQQMVMDAKIVELMEEQKVDFDTYFDPQLKIVSLQFHDQDWETAYKNYGRNLYDGSDGEMTETELGFRITKLSYVIDTVTLFVSFMLIMVGSAICLSTAESFVNDILPSLLVLFFIGFVVEMLIMLCVAAVYAPTRFPVWFSSCAQWAVNWYIRSFIALFLIYYPMTVVYVSIAQCQGVGIESVDGLAHVQMSFFISLVVLVSSINFMEVSHITKLVGGVLSAGLTVLMVVVVHLDLCIQNLPSENQTTDGNERFPSETAESYLISYYTRHITPEAVILLLLVLILLAIVNRMSEVSVRLSFVGRVEAAVRRRYTQQRKTQAEWLLFNIIPPHVALELRKTGKYSCNHDCVGVLFATVVNFEDFYRQMGDNEKSLRVLNKIVSKFDTFVDSSIFRNVDKIKTIGSTYMAASGLDIPTAGPCQVQHLVELLEFGWKLYEALETVNREQQTFTFQMRIGFNYGSVTSGVVGSRKMLYDIWGDTVNVASRMESTGHVGKIHMPEVCLRLLRPFVTCELDDVVNVKGKGPMRTVVVMRDQFPRPHL